jgi:glyoxylase-like metal-dependent hydrolase (beta-lactamase superfamily II)
MVGHVTAPTAGLLAALPPWATLVRAPNPGPMTLEGTNSWLLRAAPGAPAVLVDPGPLDDAHLAALVAAGPVAAVLVTHGHPDHVEGAARVAELAGGVPVRAADPALCLRGEPLGDGEVVEVEGLAVTVLGTPGHTADSLCLRVAAGGGDAAVLTGDTVLGRGTTVVAWPDGDLGRYLASLRLLAGLGALPVLPGHGPALADCAAAAGYYLRHRLARLDQVRAARLAGAGTPRRVVETVYADVDPALWPAAEWSVRAQLAYLEAEDDAAAEPAERGNT